MRTLEIILVVLLGIRLLAGLKWSNRWLDWLSIGTLGVLVLHLALEGYRWQMLLVYAVTLGWAVVSIARFLKTGPGKPTSLMLFIIQAGILVFAALVPILIPVPKANEPSGPYEIGTATVMLVDETREEIYSKAPGEPRKLMVQIWYPADAGTTTETAPWIENVEVMAPAIARFLGFPGFSLDHLGYVSGHAHPKVPVSATKDQYPLLIFSHGWSGFRAQNTFQVEELVLRSEPRQQIPIFPLG